MKVAVLGNCQVESIAEAMSWAHPEVQATPFMVGAIQSGKFNPDQFDRVAHQNILAVRDIAQAYPEKALRFPTIAFGGFHPDIISVGPPATPVFSPTNAYHSAITLFGYLRGLTPAETKALFCDQTYERLSYYKAVDVSRQQLMEQGQWAGMDMPPLVDAWLKSGVFMYTFDHPKLHVLADLGVALTRRLGFEPINTAPAASMKDILIDRAHLPVYPEIGARLGVAPEACGFTFRCAKNPPVTGVALTYDLEAYIAASFERYAKAPREHLTSPRINSDAFRNLASSGGDRIERNPYKGLAPQQFWSSAVAAPDPAEIDPVMTLPFSMHDKTAVATAGSCFAQHIARRLAAEDLGYYIAEKAPDGMSAEEAEERGFGVYSARYGNVYTARQMVQLFDRAFGHFKPADKAWKRPDGRWVDPFRPAIEPKGFATAAAVEAARVEHLAAVRAMFETLDVLVFTLGLTEGWRSAEDGAVFPVAPGVAAVGEGRYEFVNFTTSEVINDLKSLITRVTGVNPKARVIFTVSPVPLVATYTDKHCLTATTYSKAVLRAAAGEVTEKQKAVAYFPSYEIITSSASRGRYFAADLRSVTESGVDHVMGVFLRRFYGLARDKDGKKQTSAQFADLDRAAAEVVCEEALIEKERDQAAAA